MNRRNFIALSAMGPIAGLSLPVGEVRRELVIGKHTKAHMIVSAHPTNSSAEHFRRKWIGQPFEGFGEYYVDDREQKELPHDLAKMPGTLTLVETTIGAAAEKRRYLVGAFRRETISIIVRIIGNNRDVMLDIGDHIAAQHVPSPFEIAWSDVYLRAFIPGSSDLGTSTETDEEGFWP